MLSIRLAPFFFRSKVWSTIAVLFLVGWNISGGLRSAQAQSLNSSSIWKADITRALTRAQKLIDSTIGESTPPAFTIHICESDSQFQALTFGAAPDWGGGVAIPSLNRIVIKSPQLSQSDKTLGQIVAHEYAHLALHAAVGHAPPRFLDEGFASFIATEWRFDDATAVGSAALFGNLISLYHIEQLNSFPQAKAQLAYAESYLTVSHLLKNYGAETMRELVTRLRNGETVNDALQGVIGTDLVGLQAEVFEDITARWSPVGVIMNSNLLWGALALLMIAAFIVSRFRKRRTESRWREREKLESTDFDYGDPRAPEKIDPPDPGEAPDDDDFSDDEDAQDDGYEEYDDDDDDDKNRKSGNRWIDGEDDQSERSGDVKPPRR